MKKLSLLFCFVIALCQTKAQNNKDQLQIKSIVLQAYESVNQPTRQWFAAVSPAGDIDSAYIKKRLKEKFGIGQLENEGSLFAFMIAFQQLVNKEARADRRMQDYMNRLLLAGKAEKVQLENESIDQAMKEAKEKAEKAMDAAANSLVTGIISGVIQIVFGPNTKPTKEKESVLICIKKLELQLMKLKEEKQK